MSVEAGTPAYIFQCPTHVVVDTIDGYTFTNAGDGVLFHGPGAVTFASARNNEQNPGFRSYMVFKLVPETSFEPVADDRPVFQWACQMCGQVWPVRDSAQIIAQNAKAAVVHPGEECRSDAAGYAELQGDELDAWHAEQADNTPQPDDDRVEGWQLADGGDVFEGGPGE